MFLPRRQRRSALRDAAIEYAHHGWLIAPGAYILGDMRSPGRHAAARRFTGALRCSCRLPVCPAPGEHPEAPDWQVQATREPGLVGWWWSGREHPNIILPTGWGFDVIEMPAWMGTAVLNRYSDTERTFPAGPVARSHSGTWSFFTERASSADAGYVAEMVALGAHYHGAGDYVLAPPSVGGPSGAVGWVLPPSPRTADLPTMAELVAAALGRAPGPVDEYTQPVPVRQGRRRRLSVGHDDTGYLAVLAGIDSRTGHYAAGISARNAYYALPAGAGPARALPPGQRSDKEYDAEWTGYHRQPDDELAGADLVGPYG